MDDPQTTPEQEPREADQADEQAETGGGDTPEGKAEQQQGSDTQEGAAGGAGEGEEDDEATKAKKAEEEREKAAETMRELEKDPPKSLEEWPDDMSKYETFGGPEGEHSYAEGPEEEALGPSSLRHRDDGAVEIAGEEVEDPEEYKGDPIPGGPTDPSAPQDTVAEKTKKKMEEQGFDYGEASSESQEGEGDDGDGDGDNGGDGGAEEERQGA